MAGYERVTGKNSSSTKVVSEQISKAIIELQDQDIEKFELLKGFDLLLRKGELLPRLDSIKQLGARFSKEYEAGKSRKESIPRLMNLLVTVPTPELKATITKIVNEAGKKNSEYAELANYLIHGDSNK